ncbi:substrate-binding periplasmic protein, partial [Zooshikella harenae]
NIKVIYTFFPWKRALKQVMSGNWDASPSWVPTPERLNDFYFSDVVHTSEKVFFYLKNKPFEWQTIKDLQYYTIGATLGYTYGEDFDKNAENGHIIVVPLRSDLLNFKMLLKGRIDLFPIEKEVGFSILSNYFNAEDNAKFTFHPKPVLETSHHLIFTKNSKKSLYWLEKFNHGLAKLKVNGTFKRMFEASRRGEYKVK